MRYALITLSVVLLHGCEDADLKAANPADRGSWIEVSPPPEAPDGYRCYVWRRRSTATDGNYGGPACFVPQPNAIDAPVR